MILLLFSGVQITDNVPLLKVIFICSNSSNEVRDTILTIAQTVMDYTDGPVPSPLFPLFFFFKLEMMNFDTFIFMPPRIIKAPGV